MFTVIAFDVVEDRTRYRVVKELRRYARRVQKSVFEAPELSGPDFQRLRGRIEALIDPGADTVRYYFLCGACLPRVVTSGTGEVTVHEEFTVV